MFYCVVSLWAPRLLCPCPCDNGRGHVRKPIYSSGRDFVSRPPIRDSRVQGENILETVFGHLVSLDESRAAKKVKCNLTRDAWVRGAKPPRKFASAAVFVW